MLQIKFKKKTYELPNAWNELSQSQFVFLVSLLTQFSKGTLSANQVRTLLFLEVAGIRPRRFRKSEQESLFSENVYRISREMNFMFLVEYANEKAFAALSAEVQELLSKYLPEEITDDSAELRAALKLKKSVRVDAIFARNLVPIIQTRRGKFEGYYFDADGSILTTNLQADQFIEASVLYDQFLKTGEDLYLDLLVATLYPDGPYQAAQVRQSVSRVSAIDADTKMAIFFNFQALQLFLQQRTDYAVLWWKKPDNSGSAPAGVGDSLYSLAKAGYGDVKQLKKLSLIEMLDLLVKELRDAVQSLKSADKSPTEIMDATKLTLDQVTYLLK